MNMIPVRSSAIAAIGYDAATRRMCIRFTQGGIAYDFCGVPPEVYDAFISAPSKGTFYDQRIRDRYQCR